MRWIGAKGHTFGVLLVVQALGDTMSENIILTLLNGQRRVKDIEGIILISKEEYDKWS